MVLQYLPAWGSLMDARMPGKKIVHNFELLHDGKSSFLR